MLLNIKVLFKVKSKKNKYHLNLQVSMWNHVCWAGGLVIKAQDAIPHERWSDSFQHNSPY